MRWSNFSIPTRKKAPVGFAGPVTLSNVSRVYADLALQSGNDWVTGANKGDTHLHHVALKRDVTRPMPTPLTTAEPARTQW